MDRPRRLRLGLKTRARDPVRLGRIGGRSKRGCSQRHGDKEGDKATGFDPWARRKLYGWFYQAGLQDLTVHVLPYQVYVGGVPAEEMGNWRANLVACTQHLVEQTGERARWERFREAMLEEIQRPDVFYYCTLILVRGTVPGASGP
jgi:hypothetical protein